MMPLELLHTVLRSLDRLFIYLIGRPFGLFCLRKGGSSRSTGEHDVVLPQPVVPKMRALLDLQGEALSIFTEPCNVVRMRHMSTCLRSDFQEKLKSSTACMLPSFCHTLPTGDEEGTFIALDLGGSTFRVAVVELSTRSSSNGGLNIKHMTVHKINEQIRQLCAEDFFSWMAGKIHTTLHQCTHTRTMLHDTIAIGLAWSFPIEQTSYRGGTVQPMGKGFKAHQGIVGQDLGNLIELACQRRGLKVRVDAIVNDSSATLLAQTYRDPATRMGLILGTGTNAAVCLPINTIGIAKFGPRDPSWFEQAEKVIVNTEVSMFGKGVLPETRWDEQLNFAHTCPDFQPLEYMTTGRYLGEIFRLVIAEAVDTCHLFGGLMPSPIQQRYTLDTAVLAAIEGDSTVGCVSAAERLQKEFHLLNPPTPTEMAFLRAIVEAISHRAAAYMATAIHALWSLEHDPTDLEPSRMVVAANGSVISMYPGYRLRCQRYIADIIRINSSQPSAECLHEVTIQPTEEATLLGVAVAVAIPNAT